MALKIRDGAASAERFARRASAAASDYVNGVKGSGADWERRTLEGASNYDAGVQAAIARGAFSKGIKKSGAQYFEDRTVKLGGQRFAAGVAEGKDNYMEGTEPYRQAMQAANLPAKGPRGSAQNYERAAAMGRLMTRVRTGQDA